MNTNNVYFKKFEVIGNTKDAAINESGLNLRVDATQAYNKWKKNNVTNDDNVKEWMKDYLKKKKYTMPNDGAYIVIQTGVADTRERPYKVNKIKYEARTHSPEKFYVLRDATGHEVGREKTSDAAIQTGKDFVTDYKEDVSINYEWVSKENNTLYATIKYTPSKGSQPWKLLCFGYPELKD